MGASVNLTLADIARAAGVSLTTASRALNNAYGIAPTTRQRVLEVAERLSYVASPEASRLAGGLTGRVAVVIPHLSRWFFGSMLDALDTVLRDANLDVLLYRVGDLGDRREFFERLPARRKVDAVIVVGFPVEEAERQRLELMGVQIVAAGGQTAAYPFVCIDDRRAARQAMDHLLTLGHRRIAMIEAIDPDQPVVPSGRSAGYYEALDEAGIERDADLVVTTSWGGEEGAEAAATLLSLKRPPTAVFAHSDEVAVGAMRTIRRAGLRVPQDISIVGIDDHPIAALTDLTTVRQPVAEQGVSAARLLLSLLRNEADVDKAVVLPTQLVVRHTTAPPSGRYPTLSPTP
jgi:LacI family transcriptional regulator, repressor for deo operon, udp, cdd, tsx, nupC, and nupG